MKIFNFCTILLKNNHCKNAIEEDEGKKDLIKPRKEALK